MYSLYQYDIDNIRIIVPKANKRNYLINKIKDFINDENYNNSLEKSISRAKRYIKEISLCNDFTYFFTSTVNSKYCNRYSINDTQENIRKICKKIKRKNKDFKYLFITERHLDGAFHFHGLCSDLELYTNKYGYFSNSDFDTLGFNSFSKIKDKTKVSNYITKYISKDCVRNDKGTMYFCSRGLKRATKYNIEDLPLDDYILKKPFENDFYKIYDINFNNLSKPELLFLLDNLKSI